MNNYGIETYGCSVCFAAVYSPTESEKNRGTCQACHQRKMEQAHRDLREFWDRHPDLLDD